MAREITEENIHRALHDLGTTPDQVAETLKGRGIKGVPRNSDACPVAIYLKEEFDAREASVYSYAFVYGKGLYGEGPNAHVRLGSPVFEFIRAFDDLKYPDLVLTQDDVVLVGA